jgi:ornithine carbamoyltransferase
MQASESAEPLPAPDSAAIDAAKALLHDDRVGMRGRSLLSMADLSADEIRNLITIASGIKAAHRARLHAFRWAYPRSLAMVFEKPSLRTRVTFDLGFRQMGGLTTILGPAEIGLGSRESVPDVARNLERWVDAIMARVFDHETLVGLRDHCKAPVLNGLSDLEHPCQIVADLFTIQECLGRLSGLTLCWIGDGNNVLHSLLLGCAATGMRIVAACPKDYWPRPDIVEKARRLAANAADIRIVVEPAEAAEGAHVVYTDVWTSMGHEAEQLERIRAFRNYQVNAELMARTDATAVFMHCLPAHRGDEVTDDVVDGPRSVVFTQAENRLHAQKAILAALIGLDD